MASCHLPAPTFLMLLIAAALVAHAQSAPLTSDPPQAPGADPSLCLQSRVIGLPLTLGFGGGQLPIPRFTGTPFKRHRTPWEPGAAVFCPDLKLNATGELQLTG
jgi:hypothetical protein